MKTFEEIYRDAAVRNGCNAGKTFARVMFEEGMSQNLEERAEEIAGRLLSSGLSDDLKTLLKEAVLTGYDLQKDDFDED